MKLNNAVTADNSITIVNIILKIWNKIIGFISIFSITGANMKNEIY
jgi:hypothetical protein